MRDPVRHLVRRPLLGRFADDTGQVDQAADQLEFAVVNEKREVGLRDRELARCPARPAYGRSRRCGHARTARRRRGSPSTGASSRSRSSVVAWSIELRSDSSRVASGPISSMTESSLMKFPARFGHPAPDDVDELSEPDLQPVTLDAEGGDAGLQTGDLTVVVRPEDVDDPVELRTRNLSRW